MTDNSTRAMLIRRIEEFLAKNPQYTPESFGWEAKRDSGLLKRLKSGGDITTSGMDKVLDFIDQRL